MGCCNSDFFLITGFLDGPTVGSAGSIMITTPDTGFIVEEMDTWTSDNDGVSLVLGDVTFVGTLATGGFITETLTISPTANSGPNAFDHISFTGTNLENAALTALEIILVPPVDLIEIDNFQFRSVVIPPTPSITKSATPNTNLLAGDLTTYTIILSNTGLLTDTNVFLTDTLPIETEFNSWVNQPAGANVTDDVLTWNGTLTSGEMVTFTYRINQYGVQGSTITNTVLVSGSVKAAMTTTTITAANPNDEPVIGAPYTLFDATQGTLPLAQGELLFATNLGSSTEALGAGFVTLDTTANIVDYAGYSHAPPLHTTPILDHNTGYSLRFVAQLITETHISNDRAGFSVIAISSDGIRGIELGFWTDRIWAQEGGDTEPPLFTHAEEALFDTTTGLIQYELVINNYEYSLLAAGNEILRGRLRDYTDFSGPIDPYETPNFVFLGDDTTSAQAEVRLGAIELVTDANPANKVVQHGIPLPITDIRGLDVDAASDNVVLTLTVQSGVLEISNQVASGVMSGITGNGSDELVLNAPLGLINTTLAFSPALTYTHNAGFGGIDTVEIQLNDLGHNGIGSNLTASKSFTITVPDPQPDLSIEKAVSPTSAQPGDTVTYTLTFSNSSTDLATGVVITDFVPISLTGVNVANSGVLITDTGFNPGYIWAVQNMALGETGIITITGTLSDAFTLVGEAITNTATIVTAGADVDLDNNVSTTTFTTLPSGPCYISLNNSNVTNYSGDGQALRDAVNAATGGDMIKVAGHCAGVGGDSNDDHEQVVTIDKDLTVRGGYTTTNWLASDSSLNPTHLDALGQGRVMYISGTHTIRLESLSIMNGQTISSTFGAGIYLNGATITISNSQIYSNTALGDNSKGGGIYGDGAALYLIDTDILNNQSVGGSVLRAVAPINEPESSSSYSASRFTSAERDSIAPAALTTFSSGGGIYLSGGLLQTNDSLFDNNTADWLGGGLATEGGDGGNAMIDIVNTTFQYNTAQDGGGIHNSGNSGAITLVLTDSFIINNQTSRDGGGLANAASANSVVAHLNNTAVQSNTVNASGGGIHNAGPLATVIIENGSQIRNNTAPFRNGGGIFQLEGDITISDAVIAENIADEFGGGLLNDGGTAIITNSQIYSNTAALGDGGGIFLFDGLLTIVDSTIIGNSAGDDGGGIGNETGFALISGSDILNNSALGFDGGGIFQLAGTLNVTDSTIAMNSAIVDGGGIANAFGIVEIHDSTIRQNEADDDGGGVFNNDGLLIITQSNINNNQAFDNAGGVYNRESFAEATISDSTISGNVAGDGGGLRNWLGVLTVTNTTIIENAATDEGGGIGNLAGIVIVNQSVFSDNTATTEGGGIYNNDGLVEVAESTFFNNQALLAGGSLFSKEAFSQLDVTNSTIISNSAVITGGGIYVADGILNLLNTTLSENGAPNGGSLMIDQNSDVAMANTIIANSANGSDCILIGTLSVNTNNLIEDNTCSPAVSGDPLLALLGNYGGNTQTAALLPGSPAIDAGDNAVCPATDQRGISRPQNTACDIGAFESQGFSISATSGSGQTTEVNTSFTAPLTLSITANIPIEPIGPGGQVTFNAPVAGASITSQTITTLTDDTGNASTAVIANNTTGAYTVSATLNGLVGSADYVLTNIPVVNSPEIIIIQSGANTSVTEGGITDTLTIQLNSQPSAPVVITITPLDSQLDIGSGTGISHTRTFNADLTALDPQTITVTAVDDLVVEGNHNSNLSFSASSTDPDYNDPSASYLLDGSTLTPAELTVSISDNDDAVAGLTAINDSPTYLGQLTTFTASITVGTNVSFVWDFADGSQGNGAMTNHTYGQYGTYTATVTASNVSSSLTATTVVSIIIDPNGNVDSDNDNIPDRFEDINGDGDPTNDDTDQDGTPNFQDSDSDGDGTSDTAEDANGNGDPTDDDTDGDGIPDIIDEDSAPPIVPNLIYIPFSAKNFTPLPDLVVTGLIIFNDSVTVTIQNQGSKAVSSEDGFWVDLYINPSPAPGVVNDLWHDGRATEGLVWGVYGALLEQLTPGNIISLTFGDTYMVGHSAFTGIDLNDVVYVQVDSANADDAHGGVVENHESAANPYNNIFQKTITNASEAFFVLPIKAPTQGIDTLPIRTRIGE
ncbi:MAG: choice-of-anchor Q domain-containing protein [Chloroflexota bacterium]